VKAPAHVLRERQREDFGFVPKHPGRYDVFACGCWVFSANNAPATGSRFDCPAHSGSPLLRREPNAQKVAS